MGIIFLILQILKMRQLFKITQQDETGHSKLVYWDNPEGWDGEGGGRGAGDVHPWLLHVNVRQKPP